MPAIPSLFDEGKRLLRDIIIFMNKFIQDLSKPIEKGNTEYIEYIRHLYRTENGEQVHGILYPSSKNKKGVCCVLFLDDEDCTQDRADPSKLLSLDSNSIRTVLQ